MKKKILIIGEFPVFHRGYINFFKETTKEKGNSIFFIGILGPRLIKKLTLFEPDIRKIFLGDAQKIINSYLSVERYFILEENNFLSALNKLNPDKIFILQGEKSEDFYLKYLIGTPFKKNVKLYDIRLKWPSQKVYEAQKKTQDIPREDLGVYRKFLKEAFRESQKSKCWWRQIGAIAVKDGKIIFRAYNKMLPHDDECYKIGCIRDGLAPGKEPEKCSAIHAEMSIVAQAAKEGFSLEGAELYVTHFPCPVCAKIIANSGIKKIIFQSGSSVFDGEKIMLGQGIEIIKINP